MKPDRRELVRGILGSTLVAWLTMVSLILVMANEVAIPLDFVLRPAVIALLPALIIGVICGPFGAVGRLAAILAGPIVVIPELWVLAAGLAGIEVAIWLIQRRASKPRLRVGQFALFTMLVLFGLSVVRLLPSVTDYIGTAPGPPDTAGPPVYLLLLDGYPRVDELAKLDIDNGAFIGQLEETGVRPLRRCHIRSPVDASHLQAMIAGSAEGIPDEAGIER